MKYQGKLRGILLCLLGCFGAGLLLLRLLSLSPADLLYPLGAGLFGSLAGAAARPGDRKQGLPCLCLGAVFTLGFCFLWGQGVLGGICLMVLCLLCEGALISCGWGYYPPLGWWSVVLLAVAVLISGSFPAPLGAVAVAGAVFALVLTLDGLRSDGLRQSRLSGRDTPQDNDLREASAHSYRLLGIFLLLAFGVGLLTSGLSTGILRLIRAGMTASSKGIFGFFAWIERVLDAFLQWLSDLFPDIAPDPPSSTDGAIHSQWPSFRYFGSQGLTVIFIVICVILALALITSLMWVLLSRPKKVRISEPEADYVDEVEYLERPRGFGRKHRRQSRQRPGDFQDPAMQIRFIFQQLLRKKAKTDNLALTRTPNELLDSEVPGEDAVISAYNQVKYAENEVSPEALAAALAYYKTL